ncbi:hypothetical protein SAMN06269185_0772 [Natronoarchaeum philippinense]|uniref:Uncharacterized protein n=1 Tax=Natronoarchaeum philippinense TaxID=558529 RepID=A0A285N6Q2_NATPI|nr:hypothetical protein [Natronoarchaeum philippinense]SNZ05100.1 hypothetical protein SAMN06269185_0772 [Natronoarchaeum philippinense]
MTETIPVAVPRKGRPLEAVLDRLATRVEDSHHAPERQGVDVASIADSISSILRYEKAITKGNQTATDDVYDRLADYSDLSAPGRPEYTLLRDDRSGRPRRIVFDSVTIPLGDVELQLIGREEPFRALRTHDFAMGFDSADLVLEEVVELTADPLESIADLNARIDPHDTDVRVVAGLGDTVYHTLMGRPECRPDGSTAAFDRAFVREYEGPLCISPRYERLVEAVLGTDAIDGIEFCYPQNGREEEAAIADAGLGVYLTVTGSTARDHGLELGERLFPSETVLMQNLEEATDGTSIVADLFAGATADSELTV